MSGNKRSSRLYVGSVGTQTTQRDIEELFGQFGTITEVRLTRNFAFVQFTNEDSAEAALKELNGKHHFGKNLDVQFARAPRSSGGGDKKDDNPRDRSPIGNNRGGGGGGGPGGRGGPPGGGRGGPSPFGDNRSPFGAGNRGGNFNDRDIPSLFGRDGPRDGGPGLGSDMSDRPNDRFGGGRDFDRGGPGPAGGRDFRGGDSWGGPGNRGGDRGEMERDRPDPWGNGPAGRGPPPRDGPPFRGGGMDVRDRDFGPRGGMDPRADGPGGGRNDWDRGGDFGRDRGGTFGGGDNRFGGRPGGFRDDPPFRGGDRDFGREAPLPVWAQQEKPPNSEPIPLNTPNTERTNDIEIIVTNKSITDYGEYIESRLKSIGFTVDIMFPNENAPMPRVLGNIASRGTLYAIIINPAHKLNRSLTLQVLHGTPQEHRNMLIEDAIIFLNRNFENYSKIQTEKRGPNAPPEQVRHLLELVISAARQLTPTQYDILIQYFINEKLKVEPTVPAESLPVNQQAELQTRILSILNKNSGSGGGNAGPGGPGGGGLLNLPGLIPQASTEGQSPLLNDPTVQRALDSLIQGSSNLFNTFGGQNRL